MSDLPSLQNAPQQALMSGDRVRQAERHANVAVGWTFAAPHLRGPEAQGFMRRLQVMGPPETHTTLLPRQRTEAVRQRP